MSLANRRQFLQTAAFMAGASGISKSASQESQRARWLETAERLKRRLHAALVRPASLVNPLADSTQFLRWRMDRFAPADRLHDRLVRRGDSAILDFGRHLTQVACGFQSRAKAAVSTPPTRLKLTFGEVAPEVAEPFEPYHTMVPSASRGCRTRA